ncbi:hypothetical protein Moror_3615 [Moniliophthora roreri MCA 2997]|uniref:Uncharacterized protein n=1 Tax=Moniliophthora roreri (strain MCA 2997) TaxID=1381753 RepID=V2WY73_MONRO|nr:hypothetical protein Moror_3615 [Moniliophthora roreri MCA 2997]
MAHKLFPFIDKSFVPPGKPNLSECEGGREGGGHDNTLDEPELDSALKQDPNVLYIHLPGTQKPVADQKKPLPTQETATKSEKSVLTIKIKPLIPTQSQSTQDSTVDSTPPDQTQALTT